MYSFTHCRASAINIKLVLPSISLKSFYSHLIVHIYLHHQPKCPCTLTNEKHTKLKRKKRNGTRRINIMTGLVLQRSMYPFGLYP